MTSIETNTVAEGRMTFAVASSVMPPVTVPNDGAGRTGIAAKAWKHAPAPSPQAAKGHDQTADEAVAVLPDAAPHDDAGHDVPADKAKSSITASSPQAEAGQCRVADEAVASAPVSAVLIDHLAELQVRRKFYIKATNKQTNAAGALVRRALGWRYDDEESREKINGRAGRIVAAALAGKPQKAEDEAVYAALAADLAVIAASIEPLTAARHQIELEMARAVRKLPVYPWAKAVKGLGELGLAVIVGEAGDLGSYPKKGHLWKRLGLAPHDGMAYSTWRMKGGLTAEDWTAAGYSPRRRAEIYAVISEPLFRTQSPIQGPYRLAYDRRRELTAATHPDWTKAHSHMDGLRIMTKLLVRDLWSAWRAAGE